MKSLYPCDIRHFIIKRRRLSKKLWYRCQNYRASQSYIGSIGALAGENLFVGDALMHMTKAGPSLLFEDYNQMLENVKKYKIWVKKNIFWSWKYDSKSKMDLMI